MLQIRRSIFETNSSSVHSLTMVMKEDYDRWVPMNLFYNGYYNDLPDFLTREEVENYIREDSPECLNPESDAYWERHYDTFGEFAAGWEFYDIDNYGVGYETFSDTFTTPSGEKVVAFGYYGFDN